MNNRLAELLEHYHNGEITPDEVETLAHLLEGSAAGRALFLEQALFDIHLHEALAEQAVLDAPASLDSAGTTRRRAHRSRPFSRVRVLWIGSVAAALILVLGGILWFGPRPSEHVPIPTEPVPARAFAQFEQVQGETFVVGKDHRLPAQAGQVLVPGQGVATQGVESEAVVKLEDSARLKLGGDSLVFTAAEVDDGAKLTVEQGDLLVEVALPRKRKITVVTPVGVARAETDQTTLQVSDATGVTVVQGKVVFTHKATGKSIRLTQGQYFAATQEGELYAARIFSGEANVWTSFPERIPEIPSIAFSPDGQLLAAAGRTRTGGVRLGLVDGRQPPRELPGDMRVAFAPNGKVLAAADHVTVGNVLLHDVFADRQVRVLAGQGRPGRVRCLAFSPDGQTLGVGRDSGAVELWDVATGTLRTTWRGHTGRVTALVFSSDGKLLASGSLDRTAVVWDMARGQERSRIPVLPDLVVWSLAFAPNNQTLAIAAGTEDFRLRQPPGEVKLWDAGTEKVRMTLRGHSRAVTSVVFSADGQTLITGSADTTVRFWDPASGRELGMLKGHKAAIGFEGLAVALSPDGQWLATASLDRTVKVWKTTWTSKADGRATTQASPNQGFPPLRFWLTTRTWN